MFIGRLPTSYEHYHKKGKAMIAHVAPTEKILSAYHDKHQAAWKAYTQFRQPIREYRNKVVHDVQLGTIQHGKVKLMPRPDKILQYATIPALQEALKNPERLTKDFVVREEQTWNDFRTCKERLNDLWAQPTADLRQLLYDERNPALLQKYNITG